MLVAAPPGPERTRLRYSAWSLRLAVPWLLHVKTGESPCAFEEARRGCCFERSSPCNGSRCPYERQDGKSCFPLAEFLDNIARSIVLKTAGGEITLVWPPNPKSGGQKSSLLQASCFDVCEESSPCLRGEVQVAQLPVLGVTD